MSSIRGFCLSMLVVFFLSVIFERFLESVDRFLGITGFFGEKFCCYEWE